MKYFWCVYLEIKLIVQTLWDFTFSLEIGTKRNLLDIFCDLFDKNEMKYI